MHLTEFKLIYIVCDSWKTSIFVKNRQDEEH